MRPRTGTPPVTGASPPRTPGGSQGSSPNWPAFRRSICSPVAAVPANRVETIFRKGTDPRIDSYSGFFDNGHRKATGLGDYLKGRGTTAVYLLGLATDYCVKFTALDARRLGLRTVLIEDGNRGVELQPGDVARAVEEMRTAGVEVVQSTEVR